MFNDVSKTYFPDLKTGSDDHVFQQMLTKVWNIILLRLKDAKISQKELEEIGVALRRVWFVWQVWAAKKKKYTLEEWLAKLRGVAKEAGLPI